MRPRPRTVYSPLTEAEEGQRAHVKAVLHSESLTQSDLAKMCGVSKASMCTWLQGSTSGAMHHKIWGGVTKWMEQVEARQRGKGIEGGAESGGGGGGQLDGRYQREEAEDASSASTMSTSSSATS